MLTVALPATLSCGGFARHAEHKREFLREFMELKDGPPSHGAFSGVSDVRDPEQLSTAMTNFAERLAAALPQDQTAIDGKALKGTTMDAKKKSALHPAQAFDPRAGLVLGQVEVDGQSNETAAIPALPEIPDLTGRTAAAARFASGWAKTLEAEGVRRQSTPKQNSPVFGLLVTSQFSSRFGSSFEPPSFFGGPASYPEHHSPHERQAVGRTTTLAGGASAGISPHTHRQHSQARRDALKCNCTGGSTAPFRTTATMQPMTDRSPSSWILCKSRT